MLRLIICLGAGILVSITDFELYFFFSCLGNIDGVSSLVLFILL